MDYTNRTIRHERVKSAEGWTDEVRKFLKDRILGDIFGDAILFELDAEDDIFKDVDSGCMYSTLFVSYVFENEGWVMKYHGTEFPEAIFACGF